MNEDLLMHTLINIFIVGKLMKNSYFTWDNFVNGFGKEMVCAKDVFSNMKKRGLKDFSLVEFDYHFLSDKKTKLLLLSKSMEDNFQYRTGELIKYKGEFDLNGKTYSIPITQDILLYWALHMYKLAYEFDCKFDAYGAPFDPNKQFLPDFSKVKEDDYFNDAVKCYNSKDLSGALLNWTIVLQINPNEVNSYYSRAIVKNELYTWKSALKDYDKAIELAPNFTNALINRAAIKDENEDYDGAMNDYDTVIRISPQNAMAYFNRGNTKFNLGDTEGALKDWEMAQQLGADYAEERIITLKN